LEREILSDNKKMKKFFDKRNLLIIPVIVNTVLFILLSILHFYWAFGGKLWHVDVLPTNSKGSKRMEPGITATFIVAFGLLLLAFITIGNRGTWDKHINRKYFRYGALLISITFFIRAIGDFKFIGFFKTVTRTRFAANDTQFFSPFCVLVAVISLLIFIFNKHEQ
jgi:hypothetical protein